MSQTYSSYDPGYPVPSLHAHTRYSLFAFLVFTLLAATGCEKKETSVIDSIGLPPVLSTATISPGLVNLTALPEGASTLTFTVTARISHPEGSTHIASVTCSFSGQEGIGPLATGTLYDNGTFPDQTPGDSVYTGQISVQVQDLLVGIYYCHIAAEDQQGYSSNAMLLPVQVAQVNHPPVVSNLQAPDSIVIGGQTQQFKLMVKATDPEGQADIARVFFNSFKPDGSAASGNPFLMYDDGSQNIVIPPSFTSGDAVKGDSIYTLTIVITPTDNQGNPTATGDYRFEFQAVDRSNAFSQKIIHTIKVIR